MLGLTDVTLPSGDTLFAPFVLSILNTLSLFSIFYFHFPITNGWQISKCNSQRRKGFSIPTIYICKSNPSTCKYFHANHQHPAFYARWQMTSIWVDMLCISHVCANSDCDTRLDTCHQRISLPFVGWCVGWKSCSITHPLRHNRSRWRKQAKNLLLCFCSLILYALMCTGRERKENRWNKTIGF